MDRIEFIEMLQDRISKAEKEKNALSKEKREKYKYTLEYIKTQLDNIDKPTETLDLHAASFGFCMSYPSNNNISTTSSTDTIITLSHKLRELEIECENLKADITKYENSDARKVFPFLNE